MGRTATRPATTQGTRAGGMAGLVVVAAALIGSLVVLSAVRSSPWLGDVLGGNDTGWTAGGDGAVAAKDGALPPDASVFDDDLPGVANLQPDLLRALRAAAKDAAARGIGLYVNSGWRSRSYQEQLLRTAIATFGSEEEAARWVATPDTSPHVSGDAVDVGPAAAAAWLSGHGAEHGLCQIYRNEPWHFELRPDAVRHGCPRMYADPTQDPRMQP